MAAAADIFLGWLTVEGVDGVSRDFYVRQLRDWKGSAVIESMVPATMAYYGRLCGTTLARARTPDPETESRSPPTSAQRTSSTRRSPTSQRRTRTRTNATTTRLFEPRRTAASPPNAGSDRA